MNWKYWIANTLWYLSRSPFIVLYYTITTPIDAWMWVEHTANPGKYK